MARIAVVGVGAIGGIVACRLWYATDHLVVACVRTPFDRLEVDDFSATLVAEPPVATSPEQMGIADWVILATKAHQTFGAGGWLRRMCGPETTVAVLQNGVEHVERVKPLAGEADVLPVIVDCPAHRTAPGRIVMRNNISLTVPLTLKAMAFASLFEGTGVGVAGRRDFTTVMWRKLCLNVTGAITALENQPLGVMRRPEIQELARALILECAAVGRAEGAKIDDAVADEIVSSLLEAPADSLTSMLQDRRAGRPLEVDSRNGAVVRFGARHGIATPANQEIWRRAAALTADA